MVQMCQKFLCGHIKAMPVGYLRRVTYERLLPEGTLPLMGCVTTECGGEAIDAVGVMWGILWDLLPTLQKLSYPELNLSSVA